MDSSWGHIIIISDSFIRTHALCPLVAQKTYNESSSITFTNGSIKFTNGLPAPGAIGARVSGSSSSSVAVSCVGIWTSGKPNPLQTLLHGPGSVRWPHLGLERVPHRQGIEHRPARKRVTAGCDSDCPSPPPHPLPLPVPAPLLVGNTTTGINLSTRFMFPITQRGDWHGKVIVLSYWTDLYA